LNEFDGDGVPFSLRSIEDHLRGDWGGAEKERRWERRRRRKGGRVGELELNIFASSSSSLSGCRLPDAV